jgi:hypothetical protein
MRVSSDGSLDGAHALISNFEPAGDNEDSYKDYPFHADSNGHLFLTLNEDAAPIYAFQFTGDTNGAIDYDTATNIADPSNGLQYVAVSIVDSAITLSINGDSVLQSDGTWLHTGPGGDPQDGYQQITLTAEGVNGEVINLCPATPTEPPTSTSTSSPTSSPTASPTNCIPAPGTDFVMKVSSATDFYNFYVWASCDGACDAPTDGTAVYFNGAEGAVFSIDASGHVYTNFNGNLYYAYQPTSVPDGDRENLLFSTVDFIAGGDNSYAQFTIGDDGAVGIEVDGYTSFLFNKGYLAIGVADGEDWRAMTLQASCI